MSLSKTIFELTELAEPFSLFVGGPVFVAVGGFCIESSPYEQERAIVQKAVASRQIEFYSGRHYAREALCNAGGLPEMILRAEKGNPIWPKGFSGSISHDQQRVIAVVVHEASVKGIGVDLIFDARSVEPQLQSLIACETELQYLTQAFPHIPPLALAFGIKESAVKAVSPNIDHYLDLLDIHLGLDGCDVLASLPKLGLILRSRVFQLDRGFVTVSVLHSNVQ